MNRTFRFLVALTLPAFCSATFPLFGQDKDETSGPEKFQLEMQKYRFEQQSPTTVLSLKKQPLLNWSNPARNGEQGAVFLWTTDGQPAVVGTSFTYTYSGEVRRKHAFHVLTNNAVTGSFADVRMWNPPKGSFAEKVIESAPAPGATAGQRSRQLRLLARKFQVILTTKDKRQEVCRLVPQPLFRFESGGGKKSGAIFSFAVGTDPEALLLLDLRETEPGQTAWHYAFARFTFYPLEAKLNGDSVWKVDQSQSLTSNILHSPDYHKEPYITFRAEWLDEIDTSAASRLQLNYQKQ